MTQGRELARNSLYNILGNGLPLLVALVAIPVVVHGLGEERFGVLGLLWMFMVVLGDVGFGRAGTRFLALYRGRPDSGGPVRRVVAVTLVAQVTLGVLFGALMALVAEPLTREVLHMPPALHAEAAAGFLILAATCPFLTLSAGFRGFLEAEQRFGTVNVIRLVGSSLTYLLPAAAVAAGWHIPGIMLLLLAQRAAMMVAFAWAGRDVWARARGQRSGGVAGSTGDRYSGPDAPSMPAVSDILGFGIWSTVSTAVSPILVYLDRFLLGALVGVAAVGLYTAPYELITRVLLIPGSVAAVLLPAVSTLQGQGMHAELQRVFRKASVAILAVMAPIAVGFAVLAGPGLRVWLGPAAVPQSVAALQVLAPGVLANALAMVPFATLQGLGRADITGKLHLLELPIQVPVAWWMVSRWGVVGAAGAWSVRTVLDSVLLHIAAARLTPRSEAWA